MRMMKQCNVPFIGSVLTRRGVDLILAEAAVDACHPLRGQCPRTRQSVS